MVKTGAGGTRTLTVDASGQFRFSVPGVKRKITVRCSFKGNGSHLPANAVTKTIKPHALLTRPTISKAPNPSGYIVPIGDYICNGYLKPHHAAGSSPVTVNVYWKNWRTGSWEKKQSIRPKVTDYRTYSAWSVKLTRMIPKPGYLGWKVQAVHGDKDHATTRSPFSAVK